MEWIRSLSANFRHIYLRGGQTDGFIVGDDDDYDGENEFEPSSPEEEAQIVVDLQEEREEEEAEASASSAEMPVAGMLYPEHLSRKMKHRAVDLSQFRRISAPDVLARYLNCRPNNKSKLVINEYKTKILQMIDMNEAIVITGPTGCGKTTQVPQFILNSCTEKNQQCNILVTQPRRIAAVSVAKRVCEEHNWPLGSMCGYKIGLKNCTSEETKMTFCTIGVFLQILITKKHMNDYTHIILDEVHERDQSMDFALLVVKKWLQTNSKNVKVILMSATAEVEKIAYYFGKRIFGRHHPAPVISVGGYTNYAVEIFYLDSLNYLGEVPRFNVDEPCFSPSVMALCCKLLKDFDRIDSRNKRKSVLMFLPGIYEIEEMYNRLTNPQIFKEGSKEYKWYPVPLHSSITAEEQSLAFRPAPEGFRKIILATNIAESSITVSDVLFIVDFCLTKVLTTDTTSNFSGLELNWASKANCVQRAGRAGRVMEGKVFRLVHRETYRKFKKHSLPGILRCPLEKIVLQAKLLNMGSPKAVLALSVDPPDLARIENAILTLKEVGGLLITYKGIPSPHDGDLTSLGRLMAVLPVDIHITRLIVLGYIFSCLEECIIMGAALSLKSVFSTPFQAKMRSYNSKQEWANGSESDVMAFLNVYEVWMMNHLNGFFRRSAGDGELCWAKRHFIQLRNLREVHALVEDLKKRLKQNNIELPMGLYSVKWTEVQKAFMLKFVIAGAFYPNYFGRGERGGQVSEREAVRTVGGRNPFCTVYLTNYPLSHPRDIYTHIIKDKLSDCKEDMKITYDSSSKVYIEFRRQCYRSRVPSFPFEVQVPEKIPMAVYRAVKLRQIQKHVEISILDANEAMNMTQKPDSGPSCSDSVQMKLFQRNLPEIEVNLFRIAITHVESPGRFWATSKEETEDLRDRDIFDLINDPDAELQPYDNTGPQIGEHCVAPFQSLHDDKAWLYRARVDAYPTEEKDVVQVFFIDYGNSSQVPVNKLLKYGPNLLLAVGRHPMQCFECTLSKIKPSPVKNPDGKWSEEAKEFFELAVHKSELVGSIFSVVEGVVSLELYKVFYEGKDLWQRNINEMLLTEEYALRAEESFLSKANNEIRTAKQLDLEEHKACGNHQQVVSMARSREQSDLDDCNALLQLRGPFSPLEMRVFSCIKGGLSKQVTVSSSSVNSVLLDTDPSDPHERLLVAAYVTQNQNGSSLTLHETTFMPNVHGLAALIPFIFAPTLELRVDRTRIAYTGFICGLGTDKAKKPLFPEHDMEVVFDCDFTFNDFFNVNRLRFYMSLLLLSDGDNSILSGRDIRQFQESIKTCMLELTNKSRVPRNLEFPKKEFKWNLVDPNSVLNSSATRKDTQVSAFPFIPGVTITPRGNEKQLLLSHIENLRTLAAADLEIDAQTKCDLCSVTLCTIREVKLHLKTQHHLLKEEQFKASLSPEDGLKNILSRGSGHLASAPSK